MAGVSELRSVLEEVLGPLVRADGGELHVVECSETRVAVHLGGRFAGCPGNTLATRCFVEPALRILAPSAEVRVTSGAIVPGSSGA